MRAIYEKVGEHCQQSEVCDQSAMGVTFTCNAKSLMTTFGILYFTAINMFWT